VDPDANFFLCGVRSRFLPTRSTSSHAQVPPRQFCRHSCCCCCSVASHMYDCCFSRRSTHGRDRVQLGPRGHHLLRSLSPGCRRLGPRFPWCRRRLHQTGSAADNSARRAEGFLSRSMEHIWREEKSGSHEGPGDVRDRAFAKPSAAGNYVKFALSFAKLPKMQTLNAKPLDTSFCDFWQIIRMQTLNTKLLEML